MEANMGAWGWWVFCLFSCLPFLKYQRPPMKFTCYLPAVLYEMAWKILLKKKEL